MTITRVPVSEPADDDEAAQRQAEARRLWSYLVAEGAVFRLDDDGELQTDLNAMASIRSYQQADRLARAVLAVSDEIAALLRGATVTH